MLYFKSLLFSTVLWVVSSPYANAQIEDLTKDSEFFEKQKEVYQRWLDHSGLGSIFKVHAIEVKPQQLSLYLAFPNENVDSIVNAWRALKIAFQAKNPLTLEQTLFYEAVDLMEVRQSLVDVQIYDTYDLKKEPLFFRIIHFEDGKVKVEESNPKSKIEEVYIKPADFRNMKKLSVQDLQQKFDRQTVYNKVFEYSKSRFEQKKCELRNTKVRQFESDETLRFEVSDLCREVLTDATKPTWCKILNTMGIDCNGITRELLTFTIKHNETPNGIQISIEIDGKCGSGLYETVRRGAFHSMEIDFDDYLERYADQFKEEIRRLLLNGKP